jgi:Flp pilus assembly protein CpaB
VSQRRTLILVAAIAIGALASFLVWNYVNNIQDAAYSDAQRVPVYLVKAPVARGATGAEAQASIVMENIPKKFKPANAIASLSDITSKIAVSKLVPNQVVVTDMFVDASDPLAQQSFTERLTKIRGQDMTAISIQVDKVKGVSGLIKPGDYVNVMAANVQPVAVNGAATTPIAPDLLFSKGARYVYQKVRVLAIDQSAVPQAGDSTGTTGSTPTAAPAPGSGLMTLIVPAKGAQYLASLPPENIYLTLVAPDYRPVPQDSLNPADPLPAENPSMLTPYGKDGAEATN